MWFDGREECGLMEGGVWFDGREECGLMGGRSVV